MYLVFLPLLLVKSYNNYKKQQKIYTVYERKSFISKSLCTFFLRLFAFFSKKKNKIACVFPSENVFRVEVFNSASMWK